MNDDKSDQRVRMDAAKPACPYVPLRLSLAEFDNTAWDGDPHSLTNEQLMAIIAGDVKTHQITVCLTNPPTNSRHK